MLTIRALSAGKPTPRGICRPMTITRGRTHPRPMDGPGADLLELNGEVTLEQFDAVRQGLHPATGEFLRPRQNVDRFDKNGERLSSARSLYDFTVSAPKSVSVQSLVDPGCVMLTSKRWRK